MNGNMHSPDITHHFSYVPPNAKHHTFEKLQLSESSSIRGLKVECKMQFFCRNVSNQMKNKCSVSSLLKEWPTWRMGKTPFINLSKCGLQIWTFSHLFEFALPHQHVHHTSPTSMYSHINSFLFLVNTIGRDWDHFAIFNAMQLFLGFLFISIKKSSMIYYWNLI